MLAAARTPGALGALSAVALDDTGALGSDALEQASGGSRGGWGVLVRLLVGGVEGVEGGGVVAAAEEVVAVAAGGADAAHVPEDAAVGAAAGAGGAAVGAGGGGGVGPAGAGGGGAGLGGGGWRSVRGGGHVRCGLHAAPVHPCGRKWK